MPILRDLEIAGILQILHHTVTIAVTAAEAKEALAARYYNVLLVDLELPDMSGVEHAELTRIAAPGIGVGHSKF